MNLGFYKFKRDLEFGQWEKCFSGSPSGETGFLITFHSDGSCRLDFYDSLEIQPFQESEKLIQCSPQDFLDAFNKYFAYEYKLSAELFFPC